MNLNSKVRLKIGVGGVIASLTLPKNPGDSQKPGCQAHIWDLR